MHIWLKKKVMYFILALSTLQNKPQEKNNDILNTDRTRLQK